MLRKDCPPSPRVVRAMLTTLKRKKCPRKWRRIQPPSYQMRNFKGCGSGCRLGHCFYGKFSVLWVSVLSLCFFLSVCVRARMHACMHSEPDCSMRHLVVGAEPQFGASVSSVAGTSHSARIVCRSVYWVFCPYRAFRVKDSYANDT